jgi:4-amino-4-deoxy-L-arabinose transferase-like glycosyltransferase
MQALSDIRSTRLAMLLPLVVAAAIYLPSTMSRAVIDYDEGYYSQVAQQMIVRGDWVTPYANGVRFLEKPPLMYWITAASMRVFGINEFALRLPTAFGVITLVWLVTLMARRAAGAGAAIAAGLCIACSTGTYLFTREALHDIWLVLFVTLAMYAFLNWYLDARHSLRHALLFYVSLAGAVLTKSLVGLAFPIGIIAIFFLIARERPCWRDLHMAPGFLSFLALAVPWHVFAAIRNSGFLWSFFVNEQFLRFVGRHDPPVLWSVSLPAFWALIPVWFFPWIAFLPAAFAAARKPAHPNQRALVRLALIWAIVILGFFSITGRLEHYVFPALPALSLLVGIALSRTGESRSVKWAFRGLAICGALILAAGIGAGIWFFTAGREFENLVSTRTDFVLQTDYSILADMPAVIMRDLCKPAAVTIVALAAGFLSAAAFERKHARLLAVTSVAAAMMVVCAMTHWSLVICEDLISSKKFALAVSHEAHPGDHLVVIGDYESANSLNFYEPLRVEVADGVAYALIPGMKFHDAPRIVLTKGEFKNLWESNGRVFALVPADQMAGLKLEGTRMLAVLDRVLIRNR